MSKPKPRPAAEPINDPRIMFDGYKWRIMNIHRTHAPSFFNRDEAIAYADQQETQND